MQVKIKTLISVSVFSFITNFSFSQNETVSHVVKKSNQSEMISYLFSKHSVEESEQILLKIRNFEVLNEVKVLCKEEFIYLNSKLDFQIKNTLDTELKALFEAKKQKLVLLNTIENQL